jgi:hypothetical protein
VADPETYRLIGEAYSKIEEREPWLDHVTPVVDIALYSYEGYLASRPEKGACAVAKPGVASSLCDGPYGDAKLTDVGAMRLLCDGHYLFHVVDDETDLTPYKLVVLPDNIEIDEKLKNKLDTYIKNGGKILATGRSGMDGSGKLAFDLGAEIKGEREVAPFYARPNIELADMGRAGYVLYEKPTYKLELTEGGEELATAAEPYFERTWEHFCSHAQAPEKPETDGAAITLGKDGAYAAFPMFFEYVNVGSQFVKQMAIAVIDRLLGENKSISVNGVPTQASVSLMDQKGESRLVSHVVYAPRNIRRNGAKKMEIIEDCLPIYDTKIEVKMNGKKAKRVYSAPDGTQLEFEQNGDKIRFVIPKFLIHGMAVIDYEE